MISFIKSHYIIKQNIYLINNYSNKTILKFELFNSYNSKTMNNQIDYYFELNNIICISNKEKYTNIQILDNYNLDILYDSIFSDKKIYINNNLLLQI